MSLAQTARRKNNGNVRHFNKCKSLAVTFVCKNYTVVKQKMKDLTETLTSGVIAKSAYC